MKLVDASTMRELDRLTIEDIGIPGIVLMEMAGRGVAEAIGRRLDAPSRALVLCGPGNNGGDGFVVARYLADMGHEVTVALLVEREAIRGDARTTFEAMLKFPVSVFDCLNGDLPIGGKWGVVVDAVFGTGLKRKVEGLYAAAIEAANAISSLRVAVDIPTGVDADTGRVLGTAFFASLTVTFGAMKIGHASYPGRGYCGTVEVVPIGIPREAFEAVSGAELIDRGLASLGFVNRDATAYKNRFGHVLIVGGMPGKAGAVLLAGLAAVRSGAGLVTIATSPEVSPRIEGRFPELMVEGCLTEEPKDSLRQVMEGKSAIVIGPGLGTGNTAKRVMEIVLCAGIPVVADADALTILADKDTHWPNATILTPHPGEAGRLLNCSSTDVQSDRVTSCREIARRTGSIVVLKGAGTVIAKPDGHIAINTTGGPGLATAGTGDVLAGVIGALIGRGVAPFIAACSAVFVHGRAGDIASETLGEHSVSAMDVVDALPKAIAELD